MKVCNYIQHSKWNGQLSIVQAIDNGGRGLIGYADVQVNLQDINDNAPFFAKDIIGYVDENREPSCKFKKLDCNDGDSNPWSCNHKYASYLLGSPATNSCSLFLERLALNMAVSSETSNHQKMPAKFLAKGNATGVEPLSNWAADSCTSVVPGSNFAARPGTEKSSKSLCNFPSVGPARGQHCFALRLQCILLFTSADGVFVLTAAATDHDDPRTPNAQLTYGLALNKEINGREVFRIDPKTGKIFALVGRPEN